MIRKNRFQVVDIQNATLSGGVAVGAIADLMLQPGGAFVMGSITGAVSAFGYRILQVNLRQFIIFYPVSVDLNFEK